MTEDGHHHRVFLKVFLVNDAGVEFGGPVMMVPGDFLEVRNADTGQTLMIQMLVISEQASRFVPKLVKGSKVVKFERRPGSSPSGSGS